MRRQARPVSTSAWEKNWPQTSHLFQSLFEFVAVDKARVGVEFPLDAEIEPLDSLPSLRLGPLELLALIGRAFEDKLMEPTCAVEETQRAVDR